MEDEKAGLLRYLRAQPENALEAVSEAKIGRWVVRRKTATLEALDGTVVHRLHGGKHGPWLSTLGQADAPPHIFEGHTTPAAVQAAYEALGWSIVGETPGDLKRT